MLILLYIYIYIYIYIVYHFEKSNILMFVTFGKLCILLCAVFEKLFIIHYYIYNLSFRKI